MAPRTKGLRPCVAKCGDIIRPNSWKPEDYPGTLAHAADGLCGKCYKKRKARLISAYGQEAPVRPTAEQNRESTRAFLAKISADRMRLEQRSKVRMRIK